MRDVGKFLMPPLQEFKDGRPLPIVISRDATGKGSLQFTTIAARSPWATKSAQLLHTSSVLGVAATAEKAHVGYLVLTWR